ncbi:MAG: hypothetical protein H0X25_10455, partial [Acidobacteriales bacterium]|nr:hypothetical protein [Terriglobales bacterium]
MQITIFKILQHRFAGTRRVETDGFYQGAHGGSLQEGVVEIRARYESLKAELQKSFVAVTKKLEAELEHLNQIGPAIERLWASVQGRSAEQIPPFITPALVALLALFALLAEAKLLSPSMDVKGGVKRDHHGGAKLTHLLSSKPKKQRYVAAMASGAKAC